VVIAAVSFSLSVTMDRYTTYYANRSGGCKIGPFYRASFSVQRVRFVKPLRYSGAKAVGKDALRTGSNIVIDILNKEP